MSRLKKWGNSAGLLIPKYIVTALGIKVNDEVVISLDTTSKQIVVAPKNIDAIQEQYFVKATIVAKPKGQEAW